MLGRTIKIDPKELFVILLRIKNNSEVQKLTCVAVRYKKRLEWSCVELEVVEDEERNGERVGGNQMFVIKMLKNYKINIGTYMW
jgi:hypothetical protein